MSVRRILLAGVTGAVVLAASATGYAVAGPKHDKKDKADVSQTANSQRSGDNTQTNDITLLQVNTCGNTVSVIGQLNPAFGNTCTNQ
jgi:hypothetical protein